MNILFTCAGRRHYLLDYFKAVIGDHGKILGADMQLSAPALVAADKAFVVPGIYEVGYLEEVLKICKDENVDALISLSDLELPILGNARGRFNELGVKLIVSSNEVIDICFDKWKTYTFLLQQGFSAPKTYVSISDAKKYLLSGDLTFPVVVKPRWGSASIGIDFAESMEELELAFKIQTLRVKRSILSNASAEDAENAILIQEKINGREFGVDILNDFEGNPVQVYVKEKLAMRAGETDKSVLRNIPELESLGMQLGKKLGHIGNLDTDFFEKDGVFYVLEMNPRFGGGYPFSHQSGANFPQAITNWVLGKPSDFTSFSKKFDHSFAKCDTLVKVLTKD